MTEILLFYEVPIPGFARLTEAYPPRELVKRINTDQLRVGESYLRLETRREHAMMHPEHSTVSVVFTPRLAQLTPLMYQMLILASDGVSSAEIGAKLWRSDRMVEDMLEEIRCRFEMPSLMDAISWARQHGWV